MSTARSKKINKVEVPQIHKCQKQSNEVQRVYLLRAANPNKQNKK